jgi:hypothetical protein
MKNNRNKKIFIASILLIIFLCSCQNKEEHKAISSNTSSATSSATSSETTDEILNEATSEILNETSEAGSTQNQTSELTEAEPENTEQQAADSEINGGVAVYLSEEEIYEPLIQEYNTIVLTGTWNEEVYTDEGICKNSIARYASRPVWCYVLYDVDNNGTKELLIADKDYSQIWAMYTIIDEQPVNLFYGWERNQYFLYDNELILQNASGGAAYGDICIYKIQSDSLECITSFHQRDGSIYYDAEGTDSDSAEFIDFTDSDRYEVITWDEEESLIDEMVGDRQSVSLDFTLFGSE